MTLLEIENLSTEFETRQGTVKAVNNVDLSIDEGEIVGLVGESGSGKSVLAQSILQIVEEPGEIVDGDIRLNGESLLEKSEADLRDIRGNRVSIIFQDPMTSLNPVISVGEQIAETIRLHQDTGESISLPAEMKRKIIGASKNSHAWKQAIEMLESVSIPEATSRATSFPHEFSGGMSQRGMIALALSCEPELLIADEPTTALDVTIQAQILTELRDIQQELDTAILFITHDLAVVAETTTTVNVMYAGEIIEKAGTDELFQNPQHPYTQKLLQSVPRIDDPTDTLEPIEGTIPELINIEPACHFAPRCPEALDECYERKPDMRTVGSEEHVAACLRRGKEDERL